MAICTVFLFVFMFFFHGGFWNGIFALVFVGAIGFGFVYVITHPTDRPTPTYQRR